MTLSPSTKLGRYEIRSKIGEGGMGEVYLAQDTKLDRAVALKVLPADLASDQSRMRRSARALTKFKSDRVSRFEWSRDGKQILLGRGPQSDDVVLIKDFR